MDFSTPMMRQYLEIKSRYKDCLLFFRLGDFYELFMDDAKIGASVLDITLTSRDRGKDGRVPMAGVPYHAVDSYLNKLVKAGYKVAICEQLTEPDKFGIVERDVIRVVTPGTVFDERSLEKKENNYAAALSLRSDANGFDLLGVSFADISTGSFYTSEFELSSQNSAVQVILDEFTKFYPSECILNEDLYNNPQILRALKGISGLNVYLFNDWELYAQRSEKFIKTFFNIKNLSVFGLDSKPEATKSSAALLGYLKYTQKDNLSHVRKISYYTPNEFVALDRSTILNLELFISLRENSRRGSLISVLDKTNTAMGGRLLRSWVMKPLTNIAKINERLDGVEELINHREDLQKTSLLLQELPDFERLLSRISVGVATPRDLVNFYKGLENVFGLKALLAQFKSPIFSRVAESLVSPIQELQKLLSNSIVEDAPLDPKIGNFVKPGINAQLDILKSALFNSKKFISDLEISEKEKTGISTLKIKFNQVFGYYIEITKANVANVPSHYFRKQTMVNAERFITPELKEKEEFILTAQEQMKKMEYEIFLNLVSEILNKVDILQNLFTQIGTLDCLGNFAYISESSHYCKPTLTTEDKINLEDSRHPVVEKLLDTGDFVSNNVNLSSNENQLLIITGPNMGGKSVYIRQVALIVLMAQIGCYVPAKTATIGVVDKIFVRSGANDVIALGLSTFMVEMLETAYILNHATSKSLIILDEIGRGTSTYDGVSIAWAVSVFLGISDTLRPKTLFATHYHELQELETLYSPRIKNLHASVDSNHDTPVFLHRIISGGASHSYGVAVGKLAGLPEAVLNTANTKLKTLEGKGESVVPVTLDSNENLLKLKKLDLNNITPVQALEFLGQLQKTLK